MLGKEKQTFVSEGNAFIYRLFSDAMDLSSCPLLQGNAITVPRWVTWGKLANFVPENPKKASKMILGFLLGKREQTVISGALPLFTAFLLMILAYRDV